MLVALTLAGCSSSDGAECEWKAIRESDGNQIAGANSVGSYSDSSCKVHAQSEAQKYCASAGLGGIRVSVSYTWQGPEPLMGNRGLVGGTVASMSCQ